MVGLGALAAAARPWSLLLAAEDQARPLLVRLDPASRAKVAMALLGLVLVGLALVAMAWIGGRRAKRIARRPLGPSRQNDEGWYHKPLTPQGDDDRASHDRP